GRPAFDDFDEAAEPGVGLVAVDDAVVDGQGHISHRQDDDRVVAVDFADGNALLQFPDAEDRGLPLVKDDWRGEQRAGHAMVRDGKASAGDFRALELILAGAAGEVVELRADLLQAEPPASLTTGTTRPFSPSAVPTPMSIVGEMAIRSFSHRPLIAGATAIASAAALTM